MSSEEWNKAYVTHIREIVALIESLKDKSAENIINRLTSIANQIEEGIKYIEAQS